MNKEVVKKWVDALESGEYKQGAQRLRNADGTFCCLGVLCELAVKEGIIPPAEFTKNNFWAYGQKSQGDFITAFLPPEVQDWLGTSSNRGGTPRLSPDPWINNQGATYWNDNQKKSFLEIAAMLREEVGLDPREEVQSGEVLPG